MGAPSKSCQAYYYQFTLNVIHIHQHRISAVALSTTNALGTTCDDFL